MLLGLKTESLSDKELIQDAFDGEVFKVTSFFLNRMLIPKLAQAKIKKLQALNEAFCVLTGQEPDGQRFPETTWSFTSESLIGLIQEMQAGEMRIKLELSQATETNQAITALQSWIVMINAYAHAFIALFPQSEIQQDANPSVSAYVEYGQMLEQLKAHEYGDLAAQEYARLMKIKG